MIEEKIKYINYPIDFLEQDWEKSRKFAENVIPTCQTTYNKRVAGSSISSQKMLLDCTISKYSEICCEYLFRKKGYKILKNVDFNIYNKRNKDWSPDIIIHNQELNEYTNIAVKVSYCKYGGELYNISGNRLGNVQKQYTWTFQSEDKEFHKNRIKEKNINELTFLTTYDEYSKKLTIIAWVKNDIIPNLFVMPFYRKFWGEYIDNKWIRGKRSILMETCLTKTGFPCGVLEFKERI